jgi:uncharacterized protein YycO
MRSGRKTKKPGNGSAVRGPAYVFISSRLVAGDIILSTVPTDLLSFIIRVATSSDFSHAAICSKPGLLVEARGFGVARVALDRLAVRELSNVRVLRLRSETVSNAAEIAAKAAEYAEAAVFSRYSYVGAALALLPRLSIERRYDEFFCSHLVAEAYRTAGVELLPGIDPTKTVPGAIAESPHLADITASVTRLEEHDLFTPWEAIEEGTTPSLHRDEVVIGRRIVSRMKKNFRALGVAPPETLPQLIVSFCKLPRRLRKAMDAAFVQVLQEEGYLDLVQRFSERFGASFKHDWLVQSAVEMGLITAERIPLLLDRWRLHLDAYRQAIDADRLMAEASRAAYENTGLESIGRLAQLYAEVLLMRTRVAAALERSIKLLEQLRVDLGTQAPLSS